MQLVAELQVNFMPVKLIWALARWSTKCPAFGTY